MKISLSEGVKRGDILLLGQGRRGYEILQIVSLKGSVIACEVVGLSAPRFLDGELFCRNGVISARPFRVEFTIEGDCINLTGRFGNIVGFCNTPNLLSPS